MLVVCQTCCKEKRFLAAASLPVALSATSSLLFLSRIEQHSVQKSLFSYICLAGKGQQSWLNPLRWGDRNREKKWWMGQAGRLFLAATSICCSLLLLDKLPVIHCTITRLWLPCSGLWSWLFSCCAIYAAWLFCWFPWLFLQMRWLLRYKIVYISYI